MRKTGRGVHFRSFQPNAGNFASSPLSAAEYRYAVS
jgi:hypothetical protein